MEVNTPFVCRRCKAVNQVKHVRNTSYCIAREGNGICGYTLTRDERKMIRIPRKKYDPQKYKNKKPHISGIYLSEIAAIKFCSKQTVINNLDKFDIIPDSKPMRIIFNDKVLNWKPERTRIRKPNQTLETMIFELHQDIREKLKNDC